MEFPPILSTLILFPIISALVLALFRLKNPKWYLYLGTLAAAADFILSLRLFAVHNTTLNTQFQLIEILRFFPNHDIKYFLGIDSLALLLIILTTFLIPICLLLSINSIKTRTKEFVIYFLLMEGLIIGAFCSLDLLLFYIFFEAMLIPMFLIIGIWGSSERIFAAYKFFLYTIFGSVLFLTAIIYIYLNTGTTDIVLLKQLVPHFATKPKIWLWLAMFIAFAIKVPSFPFHTWLPDAHVQAPTAGSVILAGVLIKLGAFAMIRFLLPFFPDTSLYFTNLVFALSIISIIYASLVALMQEDMKKMTLDLDEKESYIAELKQFYLIYR